MLTHGAVASRYFGEDVVYEAFADWTTARVRPEVRATLGMLQKLTLRPQEFSPDDMVPMLELGVSPTGVAHAVVIGGYIFNYQNRMADAMGADVPPDKVDRAGTMLNLTGRGELKDRNAAGEAALSVNVMPPEIEAMVDSVTNGPGDTPIALRQAVFRRGMDHLGFSGPDAAIPDDLIDYVDMVTASAARITDEDVRGLLDGGRSEAEVFEVTVAASVAAGYGRLKIAWAALTAALAD